jgi:hypothetical protein
MHQLGGAFTFWINRRRLDKTITNNLTNNMGAALTEKLFLTAYEAENFTLKYQDMVNVLSILIYRDIFGAGVLESLMSQTDIKVHLSLSGDGAKMVKNRDLPSNCPVWVKMSCGFVHMKFLKFADPCELVRVMGILKTLGTADHMISDWLNVGSTSSILDMNLSDSKNVFYEITGAELPGAKTLFEAEVEKPDQEELVFSLDKEDRKEARTLRKEAIEVLEVVEKKKDKPIELIKEPIKEKIVETKSSPDIELASLAMMGVVGNNTGSNVAMTVSSVVEGKKKKPKRDRVHKGKREEKVKEILECSGETLTNEVVCEIVEAESLQDLTSDIAPELAEPSTRRKRLSLD